MNDMQAGEKQNTVQNRRGIPGSTIKLIAIGAMLIDHIAASLLTRILVSNGMNTAQNDPALAAAWAKDYGLLYALVIMMRLFGRIGFPIFCFLLVEGFQKTGSKAKYAIRLGIFALISEVPFDLAFGGSPFYANYQNVFFTLLIGMLLLWGFEGLHSKKADRWMYTALAVAGVLLLPLYCGRKAYGAVSILGTILSGEIVRIAGYVVFALVVLVVLAGLLLLRWLIGKKQGAETARLILGDVALLAIAMALADLLKTDYSGFGVLTIAVMYFLRSNHVMEMAAGCAVLTVFNFIEFTSFAALIPVVMYNGQRGMKIKYFFYAFYPVHLLLIWLVAVLMGIGAVPVI